MTLRQKQSLFMKLFAEFLVWVHSHPNWETSPGEGFVYKTRTVETIDSKRTVAKDLIHEPNSLHYEGLAQDINLFLAGEWISDGGHPTWTELGVKWESMHPLCRWGGRFVGKNGVDSNHFSLEHAGRA